MSLSHLKIPQKNAEGLISIRNFFVIAKFKAILTQKCSQYFFLLKVVNFFVKSSILDVLNVPLQGIARKILASYFSITFRLGTKEVKRINVLEKQHKFFKRSKKQILLQIKPTSIIFCWDTLTNIIHDLN